MFQVSFKMLIPQEHETLISVIFSSRDIVEILESVQKQLPHSHHLHSLVIELVAMEGVAHTSGPMGKKKITLSSTYFMTIDNALLKKEVMGVLCHELVHTIQYNGHGTADGGVIEGIADYGIFLDIHNSSVKDFRTC